MIPTRSKTELENESEETRYQHAPLVEQRPDPALAFTAYEGEPVVAGVSLAEGEEDGYLSAKEMSLEEDSVGDRV